MKDRLEDVLRVEEALVRHHRGLTPEEPPPLLAQRTVTRLREEWMRAERSKLNGARLSGLVWRFAMATCLIAVLMGVFGMRFDVQAQYQFAEFMMDDASSLEWVQDFEVL